MPGKAMGICVVFLAMLLAAPAADAAQARGPAAELTVRGSHGYEIRLAITDGSSILSASKGREGFATADYFSAAGHASTRDAEARFGQMGRVDVQFHATGKAQRRLLPPCRGGPELIRHGVFVGTIRFRGEGGYTEVDVTHARGTITTVPSQTCTPSGPSKKKPGKRKQSKGAREIVFSASSQAGEVQLEATRMQQGLNENLILASSYEAAQGMTILRSVLVFAPLNAFSFDAPLNSATLSPPAPFSGSAKFERIDDYASRWEGPLSVSFPGRPGVPLTGRDFSWSLRSQRPSSSATVIAFGGAPLEDR